MSSLSMFIPLSKVDVEKRLVYGIATAEAKDRSGEVCDYALSKPNFEKWSADVHAASGGLSKGNLRAMHGKVAAGKLEEITFNDASKQVEVCAKVVDDAEWQKVVEGVYTGFSQGGSYGKRWTDANGVKRYEAKPSEISLVDLPCLASATFEMVKADGAERHHFAPAVTVPDPDNAAVAAKAAELAKAAGGEDFAPYLDAARDELLKAVLPAPDAPEPEDKPAEPVEKAADAVPAADNLEQGWLCKADGSFHATKAEARRHGAKLDAEAAARAEAGPALDALKDLGKTLGAPEAKGPVARLVKFVGDDAMEKGLRHVARMADMMTGLSDLHDSIQSEANREGDGSSVPGAMKDSIKALGDNLKAMCGEEVDEMMARKDDPSKAGNGRASYYDDMYLAAGMLPAEHVDALVKFASTRLGLPQDARDTLAKMGARNSKKDAERVQAMHDKACELGATCKADKAAGGGDLAKAADDLAKAEGERDDALAKYDALKDLVGGVPAQVEAMTKSVEALRAENADLRKAVEAQPVAAHLQGRAITKREDTGGTDAPVLAGDDLAKALAALPPEEAALILTKVSLGQPQRMVKAPGQS